MEIKKKVRAKFFWGRFSHMQGTLWEWNVEKLEGVPSQILVTCPLQAVLRVQKLPFLSSNSFAE